MLETFAYTKLNQNVNWKYLGGTWITSFYNENPNLVIFYDGEIDDIKVTNNGIKVEGEEISLSEIEKAKAYKYNANGNVEIQISNVCIPSVMIEGFNVNSSIFIYGIIYEKTTINKRTWITQNLEIINNEITLGSNVSYSYPRANYYNNHESEYSLNGIKKCGLLYNFKAVEYIQQNRKTLIKGWHVPTVDEWLSLEFKDNNYAEFLAIPNSIVSGFPSDDWNGNNNERFNMLPSGKKEGELFFNINEEAYFWTSTNGKGIHVYRSGNVYKLEVINSDLSNQYAIRLIKDY